MSVWTTFEGRIVKSSGAAICFEGQYWEGSLWFPRSQAIVEDDLTEEGTVVIKVKDWLLKKIGILEFTSYTQAEIDAAGAL